MACTAGLLCRWLEVSKLVDYPCDDSKDDGCNGEDCYRVFCETLRESASTTKDDECDESANIYEEDR